MSTEENAALPIRLVVHEDLGRSRLTVFFRLLLAVPHIVWWLLWSVLATLAVIVSWFATLFTGRSPQRLHDFLARYLRYSVHLNAFLLLAANEFPGFIGAPGTYPIDLEIDPPQRQNRWKTGFRWLLAWPAAALVAVVGGGVAIGGSSYYALGASAALLAWFACMALGRMPIGLNHTIEYGLSYSARLSGYLLLLTDRYPNADPALAGLPAATVELPVRLRNGDDGTRSRLTVFFRYLLCIPHIVWLALWGYLAELAAFIGWFVTLATGRMPAPFHRLIAGYVRQSVHVGSYLYLLASPFPGFTGKPDSYPVDVVLPTEPPRQSRWRTLFRIPMVIPAFVLAAGFGFALILVTLFGWFASLITGREPRGLQRLGAWALGYNAQLSSFLFLLTDHYPYAGPEAVLTAGGSTPPADPEPTPESAPEPLEA